MSKNTNLNYKKVFAKHVKNDHLRSFQANKTVLLTGKIAEARKFAQEVLKKVKDFGLMREQFLIRSGWYNGPHGKVPAIDVSVVKTIQKFNESANEWKQKTEAFSLLLHTEPDKDSVSFKKTIRPHSRGKTGFVKPTLENLVWFMIHEDFFYDENAPRKAGATMDQCANFCKELGRRSFG